MCKTAYWYATVFKGKMFAYVQLEKMQSINMAFNIPSPQSTEFPALLHK